MAIITISRGSYSKGKEVAEKAAQRLGFDCVSREVLLETSEHFNIPEIKLVRALHDAPSFLDQFTHGKEKYLAYIESVLIERVIKDNVVYHGLAGHFFLADIPHVLKIRVIADIEDRVKLEMEREHISRDEALRILKKDDYERRQWSMKLYGIDTWDASLYDLVIHIKRITVDHAVDIICKTVALEQFKTTPESQQILTDKALAAHVKARLINSYPGIRVAARERTVYIEIASPERLGYFHDAKHQRLAGEIKDAASQVTGVENVEVHVTPIPYLNQ
jgi:cytidylate kinase